MTHITRRHLLWSIPFATTIAIGGGFYSILYNLKTGNFDPKAVNNPTLNRPIPQFTLKTQYSNKKLDSTLITEQKTPVLVNFFASWCLPCLSEIPNLLKLSTQIKILGIAYKDKIDLITNFLQHTGNPYERIGYDETGKTAIDWGVTGVPESFIIIPGGIIHQHYAKPIEEDTLWKIQSFLQKS